MDYKLISMSASVSSTSNVTLVCTCITAAATITTQINKLTGKIQSQE